MTDTFQGTGAPLTAGGFGSALAQLKTNDDKLLWSILSVETRGFGYLQDKRPKILFERHIFHKRTGGRFSADYPNISNPKPGGYSGGAEEYDRLSLAASLDRAAAIESASWGLGQVMGFNAASLRYADAQAMVEAFKSGEDQQLDGCIRYITTNPPLLKALLAKDWARVAFYYNGSDYAKNQYDQKLAAAYNARAAPGIDIRSGQVRLQYAGFDPKGIDGVMGPGTAAAIRAFQESKSLSVTGVFDAPTDNALAAAAGV